MPPVAGDTFACFLKAWRAIFLFSKGRPLVWKVVSAELCPRHTIWKRWGLVLVIRSSQGS